MSTEKQKGYWFHGHWVERKARVTVDGRKGNTKDHRMPLHLSRLGVPDGWRGRGPELARIRQKAIDDAKELIDMADDKNLLDESLKDSEDAKTAMAALVAVITAVDPANPDKRIEKTSDRIKAAATVLMYTKTKPATKVEATIETAEQWLARIGEEAVEEEE